MSVNGSSGNVYHTTYKYLGCIWLRLCYKIGSYVGY